jgi:hypothetical protein
MNFLNIVFPWWFFKILKKKILRLSTHFMVLYFMLSPIGYAKLTYINYDRLAYWDILSYVSKPRLG